MSTDFDFDLLNELVDEAPTAGFGPQVNFGFMKGTVTVCSWSDGKITEVSFTNQKLSKSEYLRLNFESDLSELNPMLTNVYKRRVDVKKSGKLSNGQKNPKALTDFDETVEPNLKETLGKDWAKKLIKGFWAMWEDAETVQLDKDGNPKSFTTKEGKTYVNTVPRFKQVYKSKAECEVARAERFAKRENGQVTIEMDETGIPDEVIKNVKGLINSVGVAQAETILASKPFGEYEPEELMKAANPF